MSRRVDVSFRDADIEVLNREQARTGLSRSELVRRAVRDVYGPAQRSPQITVEEKLAVFAKSSGIWSDRTESGEEYVDRIRHHNCACNCGIGSV